MNHYEPPPDTNVYKHWLPLVTKCPLSSIPDIGYITVKSDAGIEIFALRKLIHSFRWKSMFMEDIVRQILDTIMEDNSMQLGMDEDDKGREYVMRVTVTYRLLFGKVIIQKSEVD